MLKKAIKMLWYNILYFFKSIFIYTDDIISILNPYILYFITKRTDEKIFLIFPILIFMVQMVMKNMKIIVRGSEFIPIYHKRFTRKEGKKIVFDFADMTEMVEYLNEVENYLESKGYYGKK